MARGARAAVDLVMVLVVLVAVLPESEAVGALEREVAVEVSEAVGRTAVSELTTCSKHCDILLLTTGTVSAEHSK